MPVFLGVHDFGKSQTDEDMEEKWSRYCASAKKHGATAWKVYYNAASGKSWCITEADSEKAVNIAHDDEDLPTKELYEIKKLKNPDKEHKWAK